MLGVLIGDGTARVALGVSSAGGGAHHRYDCHLCDSRGMGPQHRTGGGGGRGARRAPPTRPSASTRAPTRWGLRSIGCSKLPARSSRELEGLAEQRDEFEAILRSMTEAVVVTGRRGEVVLLNGRRAACSRLSGETNYRGRAFVELCRDPRLQEFVARSMSAAADDGMVSAEFQIQSPAPHYLAANAAPVRTNAGVAAAWVLVFHDITQLKSYETVRADFIANLTHEIRTPLSALCGYAETLVAGVDDPIRSIASSASSSVRRAASRG